MQRFFKHLTIVKVQEIYFFHVDLHYFRLTIDIRCRYFTVFNVTYRFNIGLSRIASEKYYIFFNYSVRR